MNHLETLNRLIQEYVDFAQTLKKESIMQKLFMDKSASDSEHPAHGAFYEAVGLWAGEFANSNPTQQELILALEQLLLIAPDHKDQMSYWYLLAIQRHSLGLIPLLEEAGRQKLLQTFEARYPRREQLPVQKEIAGLLRGKARQKKKSLFFGLFP